MRKSSGFSLIELLIVIAIIGILAGLAMPAYRTYAAKAKFSEVISATEPFKIAVSECLLREGDVAKCATEGSNGIPKNITANAGKYVASIEIGAGAVITAKPTDSDASLKGHTYTLTPSLPASGMITWAGVCDAHATPSSGTGTSGTTGDALC
ncbi:MAG: pilin [Pseudomonadota bacterium]